MAFAPKINDPNEEPKHDPNEKPKHETKICDAPWRSIQGVRPGESGIHTDWLIDWLCDSVYLWWELHEITGVGVFWKCDLSGFTQM